MLSVCIFARNEEENILKCIASLDAAAGGLPYVVHVMINGCTDKTLPIVNSIARRDFRIIPHELYLQDKANAWNVYVHDIAPQAECHVFADGDVVPSPNSLSNLVSALGHSPRSYAAAAMPGSGRSRKAWVAALKDRAGLSGGLYALSDRGISAIRQQRVRMPIGAKGEDGLLAYFLLTDLQGGIDDRHRDRIISVETATFEFPPLVFMPNDIKIYWRRLRRYSERYYQQEILYRQLKEGGIRALPRHIKEIYTAANVKQLKPRWSIVYFASDAYVLWLIKRNKLFRYP